MTELTELSTGARALYQARQLDPLDPAGYSGHYLRRLDSELAAAGLSVVVEDLDADQLAAFGLLRHYRVRLYYARLIASFAPLALVRFAIQRASESGPDNRAAYIVGVIRSEWRNNRDRWQSRNSDQGRARYVGGKYADIIQS